MRRALLLASIAAPLLLAVPADRPVHAAATTVDGSGMVDYSRTPDLKVGQWVRYHMTGSSLHGFKDDYTITILVAGEELWWGEPCFWIETWTQDKGQGKKSVASLMPYSMFGDSMATKHTSWFLRKTIEGVDESGKPKQMINRRDAGELATRRGAKPAEPVEVSRDTLGRDTTQVPVGTYDAQKVRFTTRTVEQVTQGDSTVYYERQEDRTQSLSTQVPITSLVREEVDDHQRGRSWKLGESSKAGPLRTLERARGVMVLVESGTGGLTPDLVPAHLRRTIKEQAAAAAPRRTPAKKPAGKPS